MNRKSTTIYLLGFILLTCALCGSMIFPPPFNEGDWVEPKGEDVACFHTPGVNGSDTDKLFLFREREKGIVERGGDFNSFYFLDSPDWWMRVDIEGVHKWCKADHLKLYNPND